MRYPGRVIKMGETDAGIVNALKNQLNKALALTGDEKIVLDPANPVFGPKVKQAVRLFQARHVDDEGRPLKTDGEVGAITWARLFGEKTVASTDKPADKFLGAVLAVALAEEAKKIREVPPDSNRGPAVETYLASVGLGKGNPWCCAFTYWCFEQAACAHGAHWWLPGPLERCRSEGRPAHQQGRCGEQPGPAQARHGLHHGFRRRQGPYGLHRGRARGHDRHGGRQYRCFQDSRRRRCLPAHAQAGRGEQGLHRLQRRLKLTAARRGALSAGWRRFGPLVQAGCLQVFPCGALQAGVDAARPNQAPELLQRPMRGLGGADLQVLHRPSAGLP
jgi:hypothetical protein